MKTILYFGIVVVNKLHLCSIFFVDTKRLSIGNLFESNSFDIEMSERFFLSLSPSSTSLSCQQSGYSFGWKINDFFSLLIIVMFHLLMTNRIMSHNRL